ncbi:hypothetical protein ACOMHN_005997 [Nucella lapillus]
MASTGQTESEQKTDVKMTTADWGWKGRKTQLELYKVDAFTSVPFAGNPAAVCPLKYGSTLDAETFQTIAVEMNLSETAFIKPLRPGDDATTGSRFGLRWFTPRHEIKLCGHATLASAAVLFYGEGNRSKEVTFETLSGDLVVWRDDDDSLNMDFPLGITEKKDLSDYQALIKSLGKTPGVQAVRWCPSLKYLLLRLEDGCTRSEFEQMQPDVSELQRSSEGTIVVIVTTRGGKDQGYVDSQGRVYDFVSRCFAPSSGVPEDPVTGSAQTVLAHYWSSELGKQEFYTRQCSARGGEMEIKMSGGRVVLRGKAVLVMKGVLRF